MSRDQRDELHQRLQRELFDLVVIGGGINGVAIARDAALRGFSVALVEAGDFGGGTSSRSSCLIHGGLRYLEQGEIGLVFESVRERALLSRLARHLVRPLPFVVPVYRGDDWPLTILDVGLWIYDVLALLRNHRNHTRISAESLVARLPGLERTNLTGGVLYYDYQTNDARLVIENAIAARQSDATLISYCRAVTFEYSRRRVRAIVARDLLNDQLLHIRGRAFVCAAGPWTDRLLADSAQPQRWLRPTKGVHVVLPRQRLPLDKALVMRHPDDGRVMFVLPYHERTAIGTTDTDHEGDPNAAQANADDVAYLLQAANRMFPAAHLTTSDVLSTWCGVRPLLDADDQGAPSTVSRDHRIVVREDGIVVVAGGKLTTHRSIAEACVDKAIVAIGLAGGRGPQRSCTTHRRPLPGAQSLTSDADLAALIQRLRHTFSRNDSAQHLATSYGVRAREIARIARETPELGEAVAPDLPFVWAEVVFAVRHEMALTLVDLLRRRINLFNRATDQGLAAAERAAELMGEIRGWSRAERQRQVDAFATDIARSRASIAGLSQFGLSNSSPATLRDAQSSSTSWDGT